MLGLRELIHAATFPATVAAIDEGLLVTYSIFIAPAALIALWVAAAWLFLTDTGPRGRYR